MDVIDLRKANWYNSKLSQPKSVAQVRQEIEREEKEKERALARGGRSGKGGNRITKGGSGAPGRSDRDDRRKKEDEGWSKPDVSARSGWSNAGKRGGTSSPPEPAAPAAAKTTNAFAMLESSDHTSPVKPVKQEINQMDTMEAAFKDYRDSLEAGELLEDIAAVEDDEVVEKLVRNIMQLMLDRNGGPALKVIKLLNKLFFEEDSRFYDAQELFVEGCKKFFVTFEDDRSDFPKGFANASAILAPLVAQNSLSLGQLMEIVQPISAYGGIKPALPDFLADFLKSTPSPLEYMVKNQIDVKQFFPASDQLIPNIQKWIKMKSLNDVALVHTFA
ncbi:hypothetical protein HDU91_004588, partial [Kappamyces sp. JEL0680]